MPKNLKTHFFSFGMDYIDKRGYRIENFAFLKLFLPKNFSRVSPLVYIFWFSLFALIIGLIFWHFLLFAAVVGGFIFLIFAMFICFFVYKKIAK